MADMTPEQRAAFKAWCWDMTDPDADRFHALMQTYLPKPASSQPAPPPEPMVTIPLARAIDLRNLLNRFGLIIYADILNAAIKEATRAQVP